MRFTSLDALNIDEVKVTGVDPETVPVLQAAVFGVLQGKYLGIFNKSSTLLYPKTTISNRLTSLAPSISSVNIIRDHGKAIDINVTEKTPIAIICSDYPDFGMGALPSGGGDNCYYADATGFIFKQAPIVTGNTMHYYYAPLLIVGGSSTTNVIGMYATSTQEFIDLEKFYSDVTKSGITVEAVLIKDSGEYEMYVLNPRGDSVVVVYFNNMRSFVDEYANFISFWSNMLIKSKMNETTTTFDYIDVRYGANVFYK